MSELWSDPDRARRWDADHMRGNPVRAPHLELLLDLLGEAAPGWCLDFGCGSGLVAERVLDRHPRLSVFGVDGSMPMLEMAGNRLARFGGRVRLEHADLSDPAQVAAAQPPVSTAAMAVQALHHLHRAQIEALFKIAYGRLTPGAVIAVIDPVLIASPLLYSSFQRVKALMGWKWNPETYKEYEQGLSEGSDRLIPLEGYLGVLRAAGFTAACLDVRADRAFLIGRR